MQVRIPSLLRQNMPSNSLRIILIAQNSQGNPNRDRLAILPNSEIDSLALQARVFTFCSKGGGSCLNQYPPAPTIGIANRNVSGVQLRGISCRAAVGQCFQKS